MRRRLSRWCSDAARRGRAPGETERLVAAGSAAPAAGQLPRPGQRQVSSRRRRNPYVPDLLRTRPAIMACEAARAREDRVHGDGIRLMSAMDRPTTGTGSSSLAEARARGQATPRSLVTAPRDSDSVSEWRSRKDMTPSNLACRRDAAPPVAVRTRTLVEARRTALRTLAAPARSGSRNSSVGEPRSSCGVVALCRDHGRSPLRARPNRHHQIRSTPGTRPCTPGTP